MSEGQSTDNAEQGFQPDDPADRAGVGVGAEPDDASEGRVEQTHQGIHGEHPDDALPDTEAAKLQQQGPGAVAG
jgi:hypothetical protein